MSDDRQGAVLIEMEAYMVPDYSNVRVVEIDVEAPLDVGSLHVGSLFAGVQGYSKNPVHTARMDDLAGCGSTYICWWSG